MFRPLALIVLRVLQKLLSHTSSILSSVKYTGGSCALLVHRLHKTTCSSTNFCARRTYRLMQCAPQRELHLFRGSRRRYNAEKVSQESLLLFLRVLNIISRFGAKGAVGTSVLLQKEYFQRILPILKILLTFSTADTASKYWQGFGSLYVLITLLIFISTQLPRVPGV